MIKIAKHTFSFGLLLLVACCLAACHTKKPAHGSFTAKPLSAPPTDKDIAKNVDTLFTRKQSVFKHWLSDTLRVLKRSVASFNKGSKRIRKELKVSHDSLALSITNIYRLLHVTPSDLQMPDLRALLAVLKRNDEYPKASFGLQLRASYFFTPSPVPSLAYDGTFDLGDVLVIEKGGVKVTAYELVRARISGKNTIVRLRDGRQQEQHTTFIWEGQQLRKVPLSISN